jgi:competence protein ComEC
MKVEKIKYVIVALAIVYFCLFVSSTDLLSVIQRSLPFRESGLLSGIVLGEKTNFDKAFYNDLTASGLIHIVVASGSNATLIIGGFIELMASYWGRRWSIIGGLILGWKYVIMVGWEIPIVRAMLFLSIFYFSQLIGRKFNNWRGYILTVLVLIIGEPRVILTVSFWLSIVAFGALLLRSKTWHNFIVENLNTSLWVSLWITPIIWVIFGKISWVAPLTNLLVFVLIEIVTVIGVLGSTIGLLWLWLGKLILWILVPSIHYLELIISLGGSIGVLEGQISRLVVAGWYLILIYISLKFNLINN